MIKLKTLIIIFFIFILGSCAFHEYCRSTIINNTNNTIEVEIQLNKEFYGQSLEQLKYIRGITTKQYDTINLIITNTVMPKDTLDMDFNRGTIPHFELFKKISIYGNDTLVLDSEQKIKDAFEKKWRNKYILEIK